MKNRQPVFFILGTLFGLNVLAWSVVYDLSRSNFLAISFFNVGQGDAILIETPQKHQILIDGGPNALILEKLTREMPFSDRTIDLIILTHPEHDHIAGLLEVLKRYEVENILWTGIVKETAESREWEKLIKEEGSRIIIARSLLRIGFSQESFIDILYPFENLAGREIKNTNNSSVIVKLFFGGKSFLFTGDAEKSVEKELVESGSEIDSDVLKVGHHGSKTSSSPDFIEKVSPEIAVISAGKENSYGHPHKETLETLAKYGINILRTDLNGDIKIISDGKNNEISFIQN